jgi:hypothetical protein
MKLGLTESPLCTLISLYLAKTSNKQISSSSSKQNLETITTKHAELTVKTKKSMIPLMAAISFIDPEHNLTKFNSLFYEETNICEQKLQWK